jgi:hypothetical protein
MTNLGGFAVKLFLTLVTVFAAFSAQAEVRKASSRWSDKDALKTWDPNIRFDATYADSNSIFRYVDQNNPALQDPACARKKIGKLLQARHMNLANVTKLETVEAVGQFCDIPLGFGSWKLLRKAEYMKITTVDRDGRTNADWVRCRVESPDWKISHESCGSTGRK